MTRYSFHSLLIGLPLLVSFVFMIEGCATTGTTIKYPTKADAAIISFGLQFFEENMTGNFGLMTTTKSGGSFPFFLWFGFAYNFDAKN